MKLDEFDPQVSARIVEIARERTLDRVQARAAVQASRPVSTGAAVAGLLFTAVVLSVGFAVAFGVIL